MFVSQKVKQLSKFLAVKAANEADYFPIDREFLLPYLNEINSLNTLEFIYFNLESVNPTYVNTLFLCLPELWEKIDIDNLEFIISNFNNDFSYFTLIQFSYKYLEIDILPLILGFAKINGNYEQVKEYLIRQWNNIIRAPEDTNDLELGIGQEFLNYDISRWSYIKQKFLFDKRVKPTIQDLNEFEIYINKITS